MFLPKLIWDLLSMSMNIGLIYIYIYIKYGDIINAKLILNDINGCFSPKVADKLHGTVRCKH